MLHKKVHEKITLVLFSIKNQTFGCCPSNNYIASFNSKFHKALDFFTRTFLLTFALPYSPIMLAYLSLLTVVTLN